MLSLVIPTLDAADDLRINLGVLGETDEIIIVDGGSSDATAAIAQAAGARWIVSSQGRGIQLTAGAAAAKGDWLLFLHADTRLGAGWREAVAEHIAQAPGAAACFRFRLDDPAWQARVIDASVSMRVRLLGLPYGDQGLLVSRRLYDRVGGYAPLPLMEDVDLVRRLGRGRLRVLPADAFTSARRWRNDGWFRRSARNLMCLNLYLAGVRPEKIAKLYG